MTRYLFLFVVLFAAGIGFLVHLKPPITDAQTFTSKSVERLNDAARHVKKDALKSFTDEELVEFAIQGIYTHVDPYSGYYPPTNKEHLDRLKEMLSGEIIGVGIELMMNRAKEVVVAYVYDNTPAGKAGIKSNDVIFKVNGEAVARQDLSLVLKKIRGPEGTSVTITINRPGVGFIEFSMKREKYTVRVARGKILEPGIGYLRLSSFINGAGVFLANEILTLQRQSNVPFRGFILDPRNNLGGNANEATAVSDLFLDSDKDPIVWAKARVGSEKVFGVTTPGDILRGAALVVLVNEMSASASEVVIGALQDYGRARIVGTKTFGKGTIQDIGRQLDGGIGRLTVANWFTPKKRLIDGVGIIPEVKVSIADVLNTLCDERESSVDKEPEDVILNAGVAELKRILGETP